MTASRPLRRRIRLTLLAALLAAPAAAQLPLLSPTPAPTPEGSAVDPYRRESPRSTFLGFMQAAQMGDLAAAGEYLKWPASGVRPSREELVPQLKLLLDQAFAVSVEKLSRSPLGTVDDGLPPDLERAGQVSVGDDSSDVLMVRETTEKYGGVWLFSPQTLRQVPRLYKELRVPEIEKSLPSVLMTRVGTLHLWQAAGMLLLLPVLYGVSWFLASGLLLPLRRFLASHGSRGDLRMALKAARTPLALILALLLHRFASPFFYLPLLARYRYERLVDVAFIGVAAWLAGRLIDAFSGMARSRAEAFGGSPFPTLSLVSRLLKGFVLLLAVLAVLQLYGVNLTATLAGLGIGGLAFAFAAKTSIENLFGGITILGDKILRVGDFCRIGSFVGTVEDITLFATRLRTPERTVISIPNGTLLAREIENLSRRDRFLFSHVLGLRYETTPAQLKAVLEALRKVLADHPRVAPEDARVRFLRLGASSLDVELRAFVLTADFVGFLEVQEELLFSVLDAVAAAGASVASPSQTLYLGRDALPSSPPDPPVPTDV
jgi:MscS family membrane protein